jgi:hypothetical protein
MANKPSKKALSKVEKIDKEQRIQLAIAAIKANDVPSIQEATKAFSVNRTTLQNRFPASTRILQRPTTTNNAFHLPKKTWSSRLFTSSIRRASL